MKLLIPAMVLAAISLSAASIQKIKLFGDTFTLIAENAYYEIGNKRVVGPCKDEDLSHGMTLFSDSDVAEMSGQKDCWKATLKPYTRVTYKVDNTVTQFDLQQGEIELSFPGPVGMPIGSSGTRKFRVKTKLIAAGSRATTYSVSLAGPIVTINVLEGSVFVNHNGSLSEIGQGQSRQFDDVAPDGNFLSP